MERPFRLRRAEDFQRLRSGGRTFHHQWMLVSILPNDLGHNRYGFVVGRQMGKAVTRNRVRRRLREAVRHYHPNLKTGFDVAFIARQGIVEQPFALVLRTVKEVLQQAGLFSGSVE